MDWFQCANEAVNHDALCQLAFRHVIRCGVDKDVSRALEIYQKACKEGCAKGMFNVSLCYANGLGVADDGANAREMYRDCR